MVLPEPSLAQAHPRALPRDDVIEHLDAKQVAGLDELARHANVFISYMENHDAPCMLVV